jgi:hypothetical protein
VPQARIAEPNIKPPPELLAAIDPATNDVAETEELTPEVKIFIVQALADFDLLAVATDAAGCDLPPQYRPG